MLMVNGKDKSAQINITFGITYLAYTLIYSISKVRKKGDFFRRLLYVETEKQFDNTKLTTLNASLSIWQALFFHLLHSEV